ncbi:conjugal transfer mating pair stabilization protein TraN [Marinobacter salicampi]|uniref:conjugal transfer mating pair stabilization protein TraN n=1 Tax=Marinobacter salicampi TaxID=435907 RepID=UPI0014079C1A|nr:conjugal transfer mating pair stabilization protein TraN [Marinobacter salicampi]
MTEPQSRFSKSQRILAGFLVWLMTFSPVIVMAENAPRLPPAQVGNAQSDYWGSKSNPNSTQRDQGVAAGKFGSQVGKSIGEMAVQPSSGSNGSLKLGTTTDEDGFTFEREADASSFFPGTAGGAEQSASAAFPGGDQPDINSLKNAGDESLRQDSPGFKSALYQDAQKSQPDTVMGGAYKVLLNDANRTEPDLRNDANFSRTRDTYAQAQSVTEEFSDCSISNQVRQTSNQVRVPDYKSCQRIQDKSEECTIKHVYGTDVLEIASGENFNLTKCDTGNCVLGWIGKVGHNYWEGNCAEFNQRTAFRVLNPEAIVKATIDYIIFDDVMQLYLGPEGEEEKIWQGPVDYWPPDHGLSCELRTNGTAWPNIDVTENFKSLDPGDVVNFRIRVVVGGRGDGYARLNIQYDPAKLVAKDQWVPSSPSCMESALATHDDYVGGGYECTDQPPLDSNGCATSATGIKICPSYFDAPPLNVNPTCKEVTVDANYSFYSGDACYFDRDGNEICTEIPTKVGGGEVTSCKKYEDDQQCSFVQSNCVEGTKGEDSGSCYIQDETWDCGEWVDVTDYESEENIQCDGEFLCQGDSCGDVEDTQSNSFNRAAAMLQAANFMAMDGVCDEVDVNQNRNCTVFPGKSMECKIVGLPELGVDAVDCCDQPVEIGPGQYIGTMARIGVMDAAFMNIDPNMTMGSVKGAYTTLRDPVTSAFSEVTQPFTNAAETVTGPVKDAIAENITQPIGNFLTELKAKLSKELGQFFGEQAVQGGAQTGAGAGANVGTDAVAGEAAGALGAAGNIMSAVMGAYTAVMVAYMALQIIYECTEDEINLAVKRELKACSKVGSYCKQEVCVVPTTFGCAAKACVEVRDAYCCYNSPLSRIVMEQAGPQLGRTGNKGMGGAKHPQCGGLPLAQMETLDWDQIDLGEWTGILQMEGALKTNPADLDIESLTGSGNAFAMPDKYGERDNTEVRTKDRLSEGSVDDMRVEQGQSFSFDPD